MEPIRINLCIDPERDQALYQHFMMRHSRTPKRGVASAVKADILAFLVGQHGYPQVAEQSSTHANVSSRESTTRHASATPRGNGQESVSESSMAGFVQSAIAAGFDAEF